MLYKKLFKYKYSKCYIPQEQQLGNIFITFQLTGAFKESICPKKRFLANAYDSLKNLFTFFADLIFCIFCWSFLAFFAENVWKLIMENVLSFRLSQLSLTDLSSKNWFYVNWNLWTKTFWNGFWDSESPINPFFQMLVRLSIWNTWSKQLRA